MIGFRIGENLVKLFRVDAAASVSSTPEGCFVFCGIGGFNLPVRAETFAAMLHHANTPDAPLPAGLTVETVEGVRIYSREVAA